MWKSDVVLMLITAILVFGDTQFWDPMVGAYSTVGALCGALALIIGSYAIAEAILVKLQGARPAPALAVVTVSARSMGYLETPHKLLR